MVLAAAVITWVVATGTALSALLLAVSLLWLAAPLFDVFEDSGSHSLQWYLAAAVAVVVALSVLADVLAWLMLRGLGWARWVLIVLAAVAALAGVMLAYYVIPLAMTVAAGAITILLLVPDSKVWFRAARSPTQVPVN